MITVDEQKMGFGTKLIDALIYVLKKIGCKSLSGHITNIGVLKILERMYGRGKLILHKKGLFGPGEKISYEQALSLPGSQGFYFFVNI